MATATKKKPLQFLNSMYFNPVWGRDDNNRSVQVAPDYLVIIYRDERDGKKKIMIKREPTMKFYVAKEEVDIPHKLKYIPKEHVEIMKCKYQDMPLNLARLAGLEDDYFETRKKSAYQAKTKYNQLPFVFGTDMHIEDYYKGQFLDGYESKQNKITKSYFDIEVDGIDIIGFPDEHEAPCPVNAITLIDEESKLSYTLLLRNKKNPLIEKLENNIEPFKKKLKKVISKEFDYKLIFFDSELKLIASFYKLVNKLQPDFCLAWNMRFDKLTLLNRIAKLGGNAEDIISHPDFPEDVRKVYYNEDTRNQKYSDKSDSFEASNFTQFLDQLILFASLRKGLGEKESYSLNAVAKEELDDEKLDYSEAGDIVTLPYKDYELFVLYNIKDVFLLRELENKNEDVNMLYSIAEMTRTRLNKAMRKTVSIKNMAFKFYLDQGYVMGNNHNVGGGEDDDRIKAQGTGQVKISKGLMTIHYDKGDPVTVKLAPDSEYVAIVKDGSRIKYGEALAQIPGEKFEGAVVANPNLNDHFGMELNGRFSMYVYQKVIDFDLSALYPSIIRAFNIDTTTQYGRLYIGSQPPTKEYDPAGEFTDHLESKNWIEIGKQWFNLPSTEELIAELEAC